jgi:hypothetical protein
MKMRQKRIHVSLLRLSAHGTDQKQDLQIRQLQQDPRLK